MKRAIPFLAALLLSAASGLRAAEPGKAPARKTLVSIVGEEFHINGKPTYAGRSWNGHNVQGLLMNSRMVQAVFDDKNPATVGRWAYPDTRKWDADRNTTEFINAMTEWRRHGLLAVTLNLQGGSPEGYSKDQPWLNSAINPDGSLDPAYLRRLERVLNKADDLGMAVILGYFYFGQDQRVRDEAAVIRAVDAATAWVLDKGWRNVLVEVNNECNVSYDHGILQPKRVNELVQRVRNMKRGQRRLLVGTSYGGGTIPGSEVVRVSDFVLIHGNGVGNPDRIAEMVRQVRNLPTWSPKPILFNEDDHFAFDRPWNNFVAALGERASWGFFDFRMKGEGFNDGYQSVPVNWGLSSPRKRDFFALLGEITGALPGRAPIKAVHVSHLNHRGWTNSLRMINGAAEVIVAPEVGRVMQFRLHGEESAFWENTALSGKAPNAATSDWLNFGGDKTWPAPQADWPKVGKRGWPPPPAFDQMPVTATTEGDKILLTSAIDPWFGIRTKRVLELHASLPRLTIRTTYEKVEGAPLKAGVWIITQLKDPVLVVAPLPEKSRFAEGFDKQSAENLPTDLTVTNGLVTLRRHPTKSTKIGTDAGTLLWVGDKTMVRIDSPRIDGAGYPDNGSSAEVYTNGGESWKYVELEMLGPLADLGPGDTLSQTNTYTLYRRENADPLADAKRVLGR